MFYLDATAFFVFFHFWLLLKAFQPELYCFVQHQNWSLYAACSAYCLSFVLFSVFMTYDKNAIILFILCIQFNDLRRICFRGISWHFPLSIGIPIYACTHSFRRLQFVFFPSLLHLILLIVFTHFSLFLAAVAVAASSSLLHSFESLQFPFFSHLMFNSQS